MQRSTNYVICCYCLGNISTIFAPLEKHNEHTPKNTLKIICTELAYMHGVHIRQVDNANQLRVSLMNSQLAV